MNLQEIVTKRTGKAISQCSNKELYFSLLEMTKGMAEEKVSNEGKRKLYYISAEFLIGKLLSNNLINLGIYEDVKKLLADNGKSLAEIEEVEPEPSLGNGGLGRLAACFLDSIATLGLNGDGVGLNYHYGLFKQVFENNLQHETPNPWIEKESWLTKTDRAYTIQFGGFNLQSRMYDIDVLGYNNRTTKLHLFDVETVDESLVGEGIDFDKEDIKKLILRAITDDEKGMGIYGATITDDALDFLSDMAEGDARSALNAIELGILTTEPAEDGKIHIDIDVAQECIQRRVTKYDKDGDNHYDVISAFIKSMRGSDPDAAVYYLARMIDAGESVTFIARRVMICASEDVGNADPNAICVATACAQAVERVGMPEAQIILAHAAIYVACAPKSNAIVNAIFSAKNATFSSSSSLVTR